MHSLYWRIFLAFWVALALILVGTVTVATAHKGQHGQLYGQAARAFETGGPAALESWLRSLPAEARGRTFVIESDGREMLGRPLPPNLSGAYQGAGAAAAGSPRAPATASATAAGSISALRGGLVLVAPGDIYHVVVGPAHEGPHLFGELELPGVPLMLLAIALGVSAAVCYVLARYLASPVDRLRFATRQLARGDLNVRVLPALKGRKDDLGLLAADLDAMAERLRLLLEAKQQLLRDVSHELRSPLARLQLALSLASREKGSVERHLGRIAREAERLEQLIGRTLKLVRLERPAQHIDPAPIDVGDMLRTITGDVAIEADARGCLVQVLIDAEHDSELTVSADPELLRSAFENVIRNAVRYSPTRATVVISARRRLRDDRPQEEMIEVIVRDHGPGVPEKDLGLIFEPFYRVDAARGHGGEGGEGLGLAIASRAIALHGGQIVARNVEGGGLAVSITLPAVSGARSVAQSAAAAIA